MTTPFDGLVNEEAFEAVQAAATDPLLYITGAQLDRNDIGNAERVTHYCGDHLRYVKKLKEFRNWDGKRWNPSTDADVMKIARQVVRNMFIEATVAPEDDRSGVASHAVRSASRKAMGNMMSVSIGDDRLWRDLNDFDAKPHLLNFENGTVDIRKDVGAGRIRDHDPLDFLTQIIHHKYNPDAKCPRWEKLVSRVVQTANADGATLRFLQKALGYSIMGGNPEHFIFFLTGSERCGKSKILEIVRALIGEDYAHISKPDLISKKKNGHHDSEVYSIIAKRLVLIAEVSSAYALDESIVKSITGEPVATARKLHKAEEIQVPTTWTIWLATNDNPSVQNWDGAIAERVVVIPCGPTVPPAERVPDLDRQIIEDEAEGVLAWLVEGAHMWYEDMEATRNAGVASTGLAKPPSVLMAGQSYAEDSDYIGAFIQDWIEFAPDARLRRPDVFKRFKETRGPGERPERNKLYERLEALPGVTKNSAREFIGIQLRTTSTSGGINWSSLMQHGEE